MDTGAGTDEGGSTAGDAGTTDAGGDVTMPHTTPARPRCSLQGIECPSGWMCGFSEDAGCIATVGLCFPPSARTTCSLTNHVETGCACDGTVITIGCSSPLPDGYSSKPLRSPSPLGCPGDGG
jgi:hypothetical protein